MAENTKSEALKDYVAPTPEVIDKLRSVASEEPEQAKQYVIAAVDRTGPEFGGLIGWWSPNDRGYTWDLHKAGRYEQADIGPFGSYRNNDDTIPVPVSEAYMLASHVVRSEVLDQLRAARDDRAAQAQDEGEEF